MGSPPQTRWSIFHLVGQLTSLNPDTCNLARRSSLDGIYFFLFVFSLGLGHILVHICDSCSSYTQALFNHPWSIACCKISSCMDYIHNLGSVRMPRMEAGKVQACSRWGVYRHDICQKFYATAVLGARILRKKHVNRDISRFATKERKCFKMA